MKTKLPAFVLATLLFAGLPLASSSAYVAVSVGIAPPAIPVYEQPLCPAPGYIWVPGYWSYGGFGYYWVPGAWVTPPGIGLLWTPGYWGFGGGRYIFHNGYWGPTVGFYGGINYGYGYWGSGYYGGRWAGNTFSYNTAVSRVDTTVIRNTYVNREVLSNQGANRTGFNGKGGVQAKPTAKEEVAAKAKHVPPTAAQRSRVETAKNDPALRAKNNNDKPKAEAVSNFESKNAPKTAAAGTQSAKGGASQVKGEKRAQAAGQTGGEKTKAKTAKVTEHTHRGVVEANRSKQAAAGHAARVQEANRHAESKKAAQAPHRVQHVQTAPHRSQVNARPAQAHGRAPAHGPQEAAKKKQKKDKGGGS